MDPAPLTASEIVSMKQSLAATKSLPPGMIGRLLDEVDRLCREHDEVVAALADLQAGPWPELRRVVGDMQRALPRRDGVVGHGLDTAG